MEFRSKTATASEHTPGYEELLVKQRLTEKVLVTMLEVRGASAAINRQICESNELAAYLSVRRDHKIMLNSIANFVGGGMAEITGGSFQIPVHMVNLDKAGNIIETIGGGLQTGLSLLAMRQQAGGQKTFESDPNMLAKFFDLAPVPEYECPPTVWKFLSAVPPGSTDGLTRRQHLSNVWINLGRLKDPNQPGSKAYLQQLAAAHPRHQVVNIDLLATRAAMLDDLDALIAEIDQLLLELMQVISIPE